MSRESRAGGDLSKRLGDAPAGAAADGVKLLAGGSDGRFSPVGLDTNGGELRRLRVQCGLLIGALLTSGGERVIQPGILAAHLSERPAELGRLIARLSERPVELDRLAARLSERLVESGRLAAGRRECPVELERLAARLSERPAELGRLAARLSERHAKPGILIARRGALRRQLRSLALLFLKCGAQTCQLGGQAGNFDFALAYGYTQQGLQPRPFLAAGFQLYFGLDCACEPPER